MLNVKRYDYGNYTKNYLNEKSTNKSISLQSSPLKLPKPNSPNYSTRSTNSTPKHYFKTNQFNNLNNCINKKVYNYSNDTNLDDYLEYDNSSNSLEDLNLDLNNQNSSNEEYDNSEESPINDKYTKFNRHQSNKLNVTQNFLLDNHIKHSRSYQNQFFDIIDSPNKLLDKKPTSLSLSGNNLKNLNKQSSSKTKKFDMFIMTGEHIISLSRSNSDDNPLLDIANFKGQKNRQRKIKEQNKKSINNSDQMRECLSPELKSTDLNKLDLVNNSINNLLTNNFTNDDENLVINLEVKENDNEILNNNINQMELNKETETESNNQNVIELNNQNEVLSTNNENEIKLNENQNKIESNNNQNETKLNDNQNETKLNDNQNETELNDNQNEIELIDQINEPSSSKRYPTFIQQQMENEINNQIDNLINEQSINLHQQKSIDEPCAKRLAKRLFNLDKFKKQDVSRHLCRNNDFSKVIATEYCNFFDFNNMNLIDALRLFFSKLYLNGETQERERILLYFSKRFFTCNPSMFATVDSVFNLTCSLVMLNQDLHGDCVTKKITLNDYIENLKLLNDGQNFSKDLLKKFYNEIKNDKLEFLSDDDDQIKDDKMCNGQLNTILDSPINTSEYKRGYILRKCCLQSNGKKFLLGKRKWKSFFAVLRDTVLYLHKDDKSQIYDSVKNSIRIHHAVTYVASDYKKRKNVFRLITADSAEYLISVNSKQEMDSWMDTINFVAATISAPPICTPIITNKRKKYPQKAILPTNCTKYQFKEQLLDHESRRIRLNDDIQDITQSLRQNYNLVGKTAKNAVLQLRYLKNEYERYTIYCKVMKKVKINGNGILEKANKSLATKSKPLTTLTIDEEGSIKNADEEDDEFIE